MEQVPLLLADAEEQTAPRRVFCITRDVHNDKALADAVCGGRFTHAGVTLDLGPEPDWLSDDLPADEEWRIEWSKFYYGLDLANAFVATGDLRYLRVWERLAGSWIRQVPIGFDTSDVAARRMQNWTYAWSLFTTSPAFPGLHEGLDAAIVESISEHARFVRQALTPDVSRNHRTLELYALFVVAVAFPVIDHDSRLADFALSELNRILAEGFRSDGVHRENSTHYHLVALRSLVGARENARRFSLEIPHEYDSLLERACEFALHCHRPDGVVSALSDADSASYPEVLELAATLLGRPDFRYAPTKGARGTPPRKRNISFEDSGYFFQRSGWGMSGSPYSDERFLVFDCGPLGDGGHGHYDLLSMEAYAYGRPLVVDPGRYTYAEEGENLRRLFKGTAAHNTVCIDGLDQTPYRRGRPGKRIASAHFLGRRSVPGLDLLEGRAESPCYDAVHTRRILFVGDEYWIVEDQLSAERKHLYDLRWHLTPEAMGATEAQQVNGNSVVRAPGVTLVFPGRASVDLEPGWVSPRYGTRLPAPVVSASLRGTHARFVTLIVPMRSGRPEPRARFRRTEGAKDACVLELEGVGVG
ncbi:MAG TPA: alginate lyase family protein, partial [Actinomycetota bacterium]|nr:alginate lyase family protein [Actinomycetota bacterium]